MDRVRKALDRFTAREQEHKGRIEAAQQAQGKQGGHGDHWGCVLRAAEQDELLGFIGDVVRYAERPEVFEAAGSGLAVHAEGERLSACVLTVNGKIVSAYPEALDGPVWPIMVREVVPWANGIEGQITGECNGAPVSFFDTRFYANRRRYRLGETYDFKMSAFAYTVGRAVDVEYESNLGAKVSLKGAHAYMPANVDNSSADIDDYWFHSSLEGEPRLARLAGKYLSCYPIIIAVPDHFEMHLDLFAAPHTFAPDMSGIAPGEDVEGFLWLQGCMDARALER